MVTKYLETIHSELIEEKILLEREQSEIIKSLDENQKFMECLMKEDEDNYDAFSPKKQNTILREKIHNLDWKRQEYLESLEKKKNEILDVENKLNELSSVLKIARQQVATNEKIIENSIKESDLYKIKMLETQELERQRIAREFHDSSVQCLTSMVHRTELCSKLLDMDPIRCKLELSNMSNNLKEIIEEMRQMIYDLHPMSLEDIGFDVIIEHELAEIRKNEMIHTNFSVEGEIYQIKPVIALTIYRVIHEACINTLKHANASMISVKIVYCSSSLKISILDNGNGFKIDQVGEIKDDFSGFGLSTMRERISLLSGTMMIDSRVGQGTKIQIEIPIDKESL